MQRYFVTPDQMTDSTCTIVGEDVHHIQRVMRYTIGDEFICSDGHGRTVKVSVTRLSNDEVNCNIIQELTESRELPIHVLIAQALPKGDKMEWIIQKGTELGAHQFFPFSSKRTIVKYDHKKEKKRIERWQKIAKEAAEQAHRDIVPNIQQVHTIGELMNVEADAKLIAYEDVALSTGHHSAFYSTLQSLNHGSRLLVAIGPEGGFDKAEVDDLMQVGFQPVSLGKRILRTETASQYVLAAISFYYEQIGGN